MPDQDELLRSAAHLAGEQVSGTLHLRREFNPLGFEPERIEFSLHNGADLAHAIVVHRAAGNIDGFLQQRDSVFGVGVDPLDHALFVGVQRRSLDRQGQYERRDTGELPDCHKTIRFLVRSANVTRRLS